MTTTPPHDPGRPLARRKPPLAFKLIALGFVAVFGLVIAEVGVRIVGPRIAIGPMQTRPDPYYGNWLRPNFDGVVSSSTGIRYRQRTNSVGHRAPEYAEAPAGHVICLGDSYTMGETVDADKEYAALLREALHPQGFEVVNFGRAGNGHGRWVKFLDRDAQKYRPKFVVLQLCYNDFGDNEYERLFDVDDAGTLTALPVPAPGVLETIRDAIETIPGVVYLHSYQFLKQRIRAAAGAQGSHPDHRKELPPEQKARQDRLAEALLRRTMELSRDLGAQIIWTSVGLPEDRQQMVRTLGAEFGAIEVPVGFVDARPELYHEKDPHWNEAGHRVVADGILKAIRAAEARREPG